MLLIFAVASLIVSLAIISSKIAVYTLAAAQLAILVGVIRERHLTGGGSFIFMSFLFFAVRPIYLLIEHDYRLFDGLFQISPSQTDLNLAMWWGSAGLIFFQLGRVAAKSYHKRRWRMRNKMGRLNVQSMKIVPVYWILFTTFYQICTLGIMYFLSVAGKGLYDSALGAYLYDLPSIMQAGHIFALLLVLERFLWNRSVSAFVALSLTGILFITFTMEMRNISNFRGFYITGVMAGGIAVLARLRSNVNALWLILPVVLLLPAFRLLGATRYAENASITEAIANVSEERGTSFLQSYWEFYNSEGDMNIFDTFVAADIYKPSQHPYILSWLYVPAHFIPRPLWHSKPLRGTLQDMGFTYGAPFSPGIAGFFLLDGGRLWMLLSMGSLGYLIAFLDLTILTMPRTYLRFCLYGIVVVNAMGLSRFFLWQYFYGTLYAVIPCLVLAWLVRSGDEGGRGQRRRATAKSATRADFDTRSRKLTGRDVAPQGLSH